MAALVFSARGASPPGQRRRIAAESGLPTASLLSSNRVLSKGEPLRLAFFHVPTEAQ